MVELNWVFVDRGGEPIFPDRQLAPDRRKDSCSLPGRTAADAVNYSLRVGLTICDTTCDGGCADPACHVVPMQIFPCDSARFTAREVPASGDPYVFDVVAHVGFDGDDCIPLPSCVAAPGPRERTVDAGGTTDLQVHQFVLAVDDGASNFEAGRLDLEACGCA